ncbi:hypothetical protein AVEN_24280-1 [Araneus ventricosus]|uniref:Uncharacterized protein n=1 Tax=Araneus ventricosus TaxID=182803 RepID=A0A4Y2J7R6_ARAVE|nr:hypothetical protein AVEN_24280-1 [Araneus ventricosus]
MRAKISSVKSKVWGTKFSSDPEKVMRAALVWLLLRQNMRPPIPFQSSKLQFLVLTYLRFEMGYVPIMMEKHLTALRLLTLLFIKMVRQNFLQESLSATFRHEVVTE